MRVLVRWYRGLLMMLRPVVGLSIPAIALRAVGTRERVMASLLCMLLELLLSILLPVMSVDEVSTCNNLKAAEDHDVADVAVAKTK
jgi:hypothetical protein